MSNTHQGRTAVRPWWLPAQRLVNGIKDRAEVRQVPVYRLVPPDLIRRYERAVRNGYVSVDTAELLCRRVLGTDLGQVYPAEQVDQARTAMAARRRPTPVRGHWMSRMTISDYQRIYDEMRRHAAGGVWRGNLPALIQSLHLPGSYGTVLEVMRKRGWARVAQRGNGGPSPRPTTVQLLARPRAEQWRCANPRCTTTISSVTPEGTLITAKQTYCSTSCENATHAQGLGRKFGPTPP